MIMEWNVSIKDGFWSPRIERMCKEIIPYQYEVLNDSVPGIEKSHAIENFRIAAGESDGIYQGMLFQDSDVAKWIEAASWALRIYPNKDLESKIEGLCDLMEKAQQEDGYLDTCYICTGLDKRFTNIAHGHELYCAGHLIEAAVAYAAALGKERLLRIVERYVAYLMEKIGPEEGKLHIYSGHPEIELALYKLYLYTGKREYYQFMEYLVMERGIQPSFLEQDAGFGERYKDKWFALAYHQAHKEVLKQTEAVGHCVRAMYLYCAMSDIAKESGRKDILGTLEALWRDVTGRKMYITGAIGSQAHGECFSTAYDLPNDRAYAETCASIGLVFWAQKMLQLKPDGEYGDVMELALYNGALSGMSEDGKHYFYVNPLEVRPEEAKERYDMQHVETARVPWMGCACCPPNIARLLSSLDQYIYFWKREDKKLYVNLFIGGEVKWEIDGQNVFLQMDSSLLEDGQVHLRYGGSSRQFGLNIRIPGWAEGYTVSLNGEVMKDGMIKERYLCLEREFHPGDEIDICFGIQVRRIFADSRVWADAGKIALMRGPVVYCLEEADNGKNMSALTVGRLEEMEEFHDPDLPGREIAVRFNGYRDKERYQTGYLYHSQEPEREPVKIKAVPYHLWGNRGIGEMCVWIRREV